MATADASVERIRYRKGGVSVPAGKRFQVELPATVFRARLTGLLFDTNKSFLLPAAIHGMRALQRLFEEHKNIQLLVTGHTDRAGHDDYNLLLSNERANSMSAYLRDAVDEWMKFYGKNISEEKRWGAHEDSLMLAQVTPAEKLENPGNPPPMTPGNVRVFQQFSNDNRGTSLPLDGKMSQQTRRELVAAYMAQPGTSLPKGVVPLIHGCGPFHNEVPTPPGVAEQRNRRAEIFFFEARVNPEPRNPCPGPKGCPEYPEWVKRSTKTIDLDSGVGSLTVQVQDPASAAIEGAAVHLEGPFSEDGKTDAAGAARFPDLPAGAYAVAASREGFGDAETTAVLGDGSEVTSKLTLQPVSSLENPRVTPQDGAGDEISIRLLDLGRKPCPNCEATVVAGSSRAFGTTDVNGVLKVRVPEGTKQVTVSYAPADAESLVSWPVRLRLPSVDDQQGAAGRLLNLGYPADTDMSFALFAFQADHGLETTVQLDAATKARLAEAHGG